MRGLRCLLFGCGILTWGFGPLKALTDQALAQERREGALVKLDGMQSRAPAEWVEEPSNSRLRIKQFRLEAIGDDKDNAEVIIFFFGTGSGGSADANVKRWKGMFIPPEGKTIEDVARVDRFKVSGVDVTYLDIRGTYLFKERPSDAETARRPNYRMVGVVLASKNGPYFIRLVGPADTVAHYKKGFDEWLKGFK
jgi:hypothetical protein